MKGRAINGGEELMFYTNRMIKARERYSLPFKEIVLHAAMLKAQNMKVCELREMLLIAFVIDYAILRTHTYTCSYEFTFLFLAVHTMFSSIDHDRFLQAFVTV